MELIYLHITKFRNFENIDMHLSSKFKINLSIKSSTFKIIKQDYVHIYPSHIANINAIVGMNGVGKSNILDLIGMRKRDRNKHYSEFKSYYKSRKNSDQINLYGKEFDYIDKNSKYLQIYYDGTYKGKDIFIVEGNDIDTYNFIFNNYDEMARKKPYPEHYYFLEKYWFSITCEMVNDGLYMHGTSDISYKDCCINNEVEIIMFRNNFSKYYFDYTSFKNEDEQRLMIPRRNAKFEPQLVYSKIRMFQEVLNKTNREILLGDSYFLIINYNQVKMEKTLVYNESNCPTPKMKLIEYFINYTFYQINNDNREKMEKCLHKLRLIRLNDDIINIEEKYLIYFHEILNTLVKEATDFNVEDIDHIMDSYEQFVYALSLSNIYIIEDSSIKIKITKDCDIANIGKFIKSTLDEHVYADKNGKFSVFNGFFEYNFLYLSNGEQFYLDIFSSIYEQLKILTNNKPRYILLLDEPEVGMHPNLAREFINETIKFLNSFSTWKQKYQIIIATHSPFILSDLLNENVTLITKKSDNSSLISQCQIDTFGSNIHNLLKESFFIKSTIGEYSRELINIIAKKLNSKNYIDDIELTKEQIEFIINNVGEKIVQNKLKILYEDYYNEQFMVDKAIDYSNSIINNKKLTELKKQVETTLKKINELISNKDNEELKK